MFRAILENIVEFHPEMSKDIAEAGFMAWLIKKLKVNLIFPFKERDFLSAKEKKSIIIYQMFQVKVPFDDNKLYASEVLSILLQVLL